MGWGYTSPREHDRGLYPDCRNGQRTGSAEKTTSNNSENTESSELVRQIEAMAKPLGRRLYRGLLRAQAKVWNPDQIQGVVLRRKVLEQMQSAERGLGRLDAELAKTGPAALEGALESLRLRSLDHVDSLEMLKRVVLAVEAAASTAR